MDSSDSASNSEKDKAPPPPPPPERKYPEGVRLYLIMLAICSSIFLISLDQTIVGTAIPKITDEFGSVSQVSWFGSAYFMTTAGFQSCWGKAAKHFPLKIVFLSAVAVFEVGSLLCAVAPSTEAFIVGRAVAGIGCGGVASGCLVIIAFAAHPERRAVLASIIGATYGIAAICGPLLGGVFSDKVSWRWCFYINLPIGGAAAAVIIFFFHTPPEALPKKEPLLTKIWGLDLVGALLVASSLISFILAMQYAGQSMPWRSATVIGLLVGSVAIACVFAAWQVYQGDKAMIPPRILAKRQIWATVLFQAFFAGAYFISLYYLPIYFQSVDGVSPIQSGVRNLPLILLCSVSMLIAGQIVARTGRMAPNMVLGSAAATVAYGLYNTFGEHGITGQWVGYQVLAGAATGGTFQMAVLTVQAHSPPADIAPATSINFFFQTIGGALGIAGAQCGFANRLISTLRTTAPNVNPQAVIETGSTEIRTAFPPEDVPGIISAYMAGLKVSFALMTAFGGLAFLLSLLQSWKRIKSISKAKVGKADAAAAEKAEASKTAEGEAAELPDTVKADAVAAETTGTEPQEKSTVNVATTDSSQTL